MKETNKPVLQRLLPGLILGFVVVIGLFLMGDLQKVSRSMLSFHWEYFLVAIGFTLFNYALRFLKWHFYLSQIGVRRLSILQSLRLFIAGFPLAVTPGKVGEVFKGVWLMRQTGVPVGRGVSVVVAERISDGLAVLALSVLGVIEYRQFWPVFIAILVGLLAIIIISQIRPFAVWLLDRGDHILWLQRVSRSLREFYEGSFALFKPGATLLAVFLGAVSWLGEGVGFYFILLGLGMPASQHLLIMAIFVLSFSTIVGAASTLPGGLGAAEASIAGLLTITMNMEPATVTTATVLIRLATLWFGVGLGLLVWLFSPDLLGLSAERQPLPES
jgi:glycosyltransferase 2 family protein